ncbi:META domain-containing protein [Algibacter sp. AS12]|uniref:META domain-containing protein n=1 Tax=Algibacter sp. AS12 TaxID=3135773 RepID=UPI00398A766A
MKYVTILLLSCLALNSCKNGTNDPNSSASETPSGIYTITVLPEHNNISKELTISFDDATKKVSGHSGCNQFFGTYKIEGNALNFSQMGSTRKMCEPAANALETAMLQSLDRINAYTIKDNMLHLNVDSNTIIQAVKN